MTDGATEVAVAPLTVPHDRAQRPAQNVNSKETAVPAVQNGVRASSLDARWVKSRHSNAEGNCVEVASLVDGMRRAAQLP
ncbi:regulatory protein [Streptomyces sviceus ATCC 29083]|uniref:Regulatory protein n=1 Tax=Streptomyces sviceus (strain ATCC 29083 / DSM 924 / JCM 4929 / NBRC 13980 / NCIMB 11184 / NRRL 5439 / UC 5370) TaxID=463191 RepID=B5I6N4_STRX2|nr:regulatory protein [Streptomyces sviceus ATCC 29083]